MPTLRELHAERDRLAELLKLEQAKVAAANGGVLELPAYRRHLQQNCSDLLAQYEAIELELKREMRALGGLEGRMAALRGGGGIAAQLAALRERLERIR